jgi:hypothetical protein
VRLTSENLAVLSSRPHIETNISLAVLIPNVVLHDEEYQTVQYPEERMALQQIISWIVPSVLLCFISISFPPTLHSQRVFG